MKPSQLIQKSGLLENTQRLLVGDPQKVHNSQVFFLPQRDIRYYPDAQLPRTPVAFETVEQYPASPLVYSFQRFFDAPLGDGGQ